MDTKRFNFTGLFSGAWNRGEPSLEVIEKSLKEVIDLLSAKHKIQIQIDEAALRDSAIGGSDVPITKVLKNVSLEISQRQGSLPGLGGIGGGSMCLPIPDKAVENPNPQNDSDADPFG